MDYEKLNNEENQKIQDCITQITKWLNEKQKDVLKGIYVDIPMKKYNITFCLTNKYCYIMSGNTSYDIIPLIHSKDKKIQDASTDYNIALIQNWRNIKENILSSLKEQKETMELISNFVV